MAINPTQLAAQEISTVTDFAIEITYTRIVHGQLIDPPVTPYQLVGFFNTFNNRVELFCTNATGSRYIKVM